MILDPLSENILKDSVNTPTLQNPFETFNINLFPSISATSSSNVGEGADYTSYLKSFLSEDRNAAAAPLYDVTKEQKERYDNPYLAYTPFTQSAKTIEGVYGMYQGAGEQLLNGILKGGVKAAGTFLESFAAVPNQIDAARKGDVSNALFAESSSFNAISNWMDSFENSLPNYLTDLEQERPWYVNAFTPTGAANFWGDTIIKNGGFMLGAIASAAVVDGAITLATGGLGAEFALVDFGRRIGSTIPKMKSAFRGLSKVAALGKTDDVIGIMNTGENLLEATKLAKQTSTLSQIGKAGHFAATTYFSTQGEAMIEGYHTYVDTKTKLLEEAISRGESLTPELLAGIEDTASNAGKMTAIFNAAVLTPSNMIQFPKLMGWKKMTNLTKKIDSPYIKYDIQGEGLKAINTYTRKKAVANVLKDVGLKSFLPEGLEEGAQYFIGNSLHDYYIDKFNNKTKAGMAEYMLDALPKTLSEGEFWKEFFIGAISSTTFGGLIPKSEMQSTIKSNLIGAKARTDGYVSSINDNLDKFNAASAQLTSFGELLNFDAAPTPSAPYTPKAQFDFINKHESAYKAFHRVVSDAATFGQLDNLKDSLNDLKEMSLEEFNKLAYVGTGIPGGEKGVKTEAEKEEKLNQMLIEIDKIQEDLDAVEESFKVNPFENKAFKARLKEKGLKDKDIKNAAYSLFQDFKKNQVYTIGRLRNIQDTQNTYFNELKFGANLDPDSIENLKTVLLNIEDKESIDAYLSYKNRVLQSLSTQYDLYTSEGTKDPFNARKIKAAISSLKSVISKLDQYKAKETLSPEEKEELTTLLFQEEFGESQASAAYMLDMQTLQLLKKAAEEELKRAQDNPDVAAEDLFKVVEELNDIEEQEKDITEEPEDQDDKEDQEDQEQKIEELEEEEKEERVDEIEFTDEELLKAAQEGAETGTETGTEDISLEDVEDEVLGSKEELADMQNVPLETEGEEEILDSVFEETEQDLTEQQTEDILKETEGADIESELTPEQVEAMLAEMPSEPSEEDIRIAKELFDYLSNVPLNTKVSFKNQPHQVITIKEDVVTLLSPSNETIAITPNGVFDFANRNVGLVEEDLQMIPDVLESMPKFEEKSKNLQSVNSRIDALTEYHKKIKANKRVVNPPYKVGQLYLTSNSKVLGKTGFFIVYKFVKKEGKDNIFEKHFIKINSKGELYSKKEKNEAVKYSLVEITDPSQEQALPKEQQPTPPTLPTQPQSSVVTKQILDKQKKEAENPTIDTTFKTPSGKSFKVKVDMSKVSPIIIPIEDKFLHLGMQGRMFVLAKVGEVTLPFYMSSEGTSGKAKGKWFPFFASTEKWIVKGSTKEMSNGYGIKEIQDVQKLLNENIVIDFYPVELGPEGKVKSTDGNVLFDLNKYASVTPARGDSWSTDNNEINKKLNIPTQDTKGMSPVDIFNLYFNQWLEKFQSFSKSVLPSQPQPQPTDLPEKESEINKIKNENTQLGQSILKKAGFKNENRLPNGNVKGGQAGWKIRFNIKSLTGENYFNKSSKFLENDKHYNEQAEKLVDWLNSYFQTTSKGSVQEAIKGNNLYGFNKENPTSIWKFLSGGEIGESDFTIYIGSADDVLKFIQDVKDSPIANLLVAGNKGSDVNITSDGIFKARIEGSRIGFSGYHVPTNLNKVVGANEFAFVHNGDTIVINYGNGNLSDIFVYNERTQKGYNAVFDEKMKKDLPELYKNIRNIIGFQLYGKYLTGSNNEFVTITKVNKADLSTETLSQPQPQPQSPEQDLKEKLDSLNKKLEELNKRQDKERGELNKKEGKNYISSFDILNINEYSSDQSPRSDEAIELANRHEAELAKLIKEKRELDSEADNRIYSPYDFSGNKREFDAIKQELNKIYAVNKNALDEGFEIASQALNEANEVGGSEYAAHGMGKATLANASEALYVLFRKGINPIRSGGLYTAPLSGGISTGETASGNAYMDGPFTLVTKKGHIGFITDIEQVAGIIVNEGIATPVILDSLRSIFPDLVIESTSNTKALVEQLNEKENPNSSETVVNVTAQKIDPQEVNKNIMEFIGLKADLYAVFQNAINNNIISIKCD